MFIYDQFWSHFEYVLSKPILLITIIIACVRFFLFFLPLFCLVKIFKLKYLKDDYGWSESANAKRFIDLKIDLKSLMEKNLSNLWPETKQKKIVTSFSFFRHVCNAFQF